MNLFYRFFLNSFCGCIVSTFDELENNDPNWSREDTVDYIKNNHEALSEESKDDNGEGRQGGDDTLYGGEGADP